MALWEEESVFRDPPQQLKCYKQYIDDLVMIWEGGRCSLETFMLKLNTNMNNISLSWNIDSRQIVFLDLEIFKDGDSFKTWNNFKPSDRNGYIPLDSCHHRSWLCNIPRGKLIRLRCNFTSGSDFLAQSNILAERFQQKDYSKDVIHKEIARVGSLNRSDLISDSNNKKEVKHEFKIILDYNIQHKQFEKIVRKHCEVLLRKDEVLRAVLPPRPLFIYKRAPTLWDVIAPGVIDPPVFKENRIFSFLTGFFACGRCQAYKQCKFNNKKQKEFTSFSTKKSYTIRNLITCGTVGVVYMLECNCGF